MDAARNADAAAFPASRLPSHTERRRRVLRRLQAVAIGAAFAGGGAAYVACRVWLGEAAAALLAVALPIAMVLRLRTWADVPRVEPQGLLLDEALVAAWLAGALTAPVALLVVFFGAPQDLASIAYVAALVVAAWGVWGERHWLDVRRRRVVVTSLPPAFDGMRCVHLSDVHLGPLHRPGFQRRWAKAVQRERPDVVVVTGDLVASGTACYERAAAALGSLRAPHGVLVVLGNHDQVDAPRLTKQLRSRGVTVLCNDHAELCREGETLVVAGTSEASGRVGDVAPAVAACREPPAILLSHYPAVFPEASAAGVPLCLAGHSHGGQVAALRLNDRETARHARGEFRRGSSLLYVSRGLGTTGLPIRLGARPEIGVLELCRGHSPPRSPAAPSPLAGALCLAFFGATSCSSPPPSAPRRTSLLEGAVVAAPYRSPAVWHYHPREHGELLSRRDLPGGATLYSSSRGERWLATDGGNTIESANTLAPEPLLASFSTPVGHWVFVGESGTTYESTSPLGSFTRSSPPLEPLRRVVAAGSDIAGIRHDGRLVHSDDAGGNWRTVGPKKRFVDIAMDGEGSAMALAIPEQLYRSTDGGENWARLDVPAAGAQRFVSGDPIELRTALGRMRYDATASRLRPVVGPSDPSRRVALPGDLPLGRSATALRSGTAAISGIRYYELSQTEDERTPQWELLSGIDGDPLDRTPIPEMQGCRWARLTVSRKRLLAACGRQAARGSNSEPIVLLSSTNFGKTWSRRLAGVHGRHADLRLAVTEAGRAFLTGVCPAKSSEPGCLPMGVHWTSLAAEGDGKQGDGKQGTEEPALGAPEPVNLPALASTALALVPTIDGRSVFVVGRRTKNDRLAVYVSRDGERFEAREVDGIPTDFSTEANVASAAQASDGSLSIVLSDDANGEMLLLLDEDARLVSHASAPLAGAQLAGYGSFALAVHGGKRQLWESANAGVTWEPLGVLPVAVCGGDSCNTPVLCAASGCTIGDSLSRVGWRGQEANAAGTLPITDDGPGRFLSRSVKAPIACTVAEAGWVAVPSLIAVPQADQASVGDVAWFGVQEDFGTASANVVLARAGVPPRIDTRVLFPPAGHPERYALHATLQVEGGAAVRYVVPEPGVVAPMRNVEVAWENLFEKRAGRGRIADAGRYASGDSAATRDRARRAEPAIVSIASGGIHVQPHRSRPRQTTYFLDGRAVTTTTSPPWPAETLSGRDELVRISGQSLFVRFLARGAGMVRAAREPSGDWSFAAMTVGFPNPAELGMSQAFDLTYVGGNAALQLLTGVADARQARAMAFPVQATGDVFGPPVAIPTQLDLPALPQPCDDAQVGNTPRVVVPYQPGSRHPVVISAAVEPLRIMLTGSAVLHGTPDSACARSMDASPVQRSTADPAEERALVDLDTPQQSWLFRVVRSENPTVEYRSMSCQFEPSMPIPEEVYSAQGTRVRVHAGAVP